MPWYENDWNMSQVFQPQYQIRDELFEQLSAVQELDNAAIFSIGDDASLNPQPLPPEIDDAAISDQVIDNAAIYDAAIHDASIASVGDAVSLNPQPLPSKIDNAASYEGAIVSVGDAVSLNPQPLPPKIFTKVLSSYAIR